MDFGSLYNSDIRTIATFVNIQGEVTLSYFIPVPPVYFNEYSILYRNGRFAKLPNGEA